MSQNDKHFTGIKDPEIERLLQDVIQQTAVDISEVAPQFLEAVILGGGYGRGEGGVCQDTGKPMLYNDIDFFVVTKNATASQKRELAAIFEPISKKLEKKLQIDVDFSPAKNENELGKMTGTLMFQELKHGHILVYGNESVLEKIEAIKEENLPFMEAIRLLMNRGIGLIFAAEKIAQHSEDTGFIARNINKAILGCGDAMLLANGKYKWKLEDRILAVEQLQCPLSDLSQAYAKASYFKYHPTKNIPQDVQMHWKSIRNLWCGTVSLILENNEEIDSAITQICARNNSRNLRNLLRFAFKTHSLAGGISSCLNEPFARVLAYIYKILKSNDSPEKVILPKHILRLWQLFS